MKRIILLVCLFAVPGFTQDNAPKPLGESELIRKVTSKLDPGGHFYMYWNPDELRDRMVPLAMEFGKAIKQSPVARETPEADMMMKMFGKFYEQSGLGEVGGLGMSSIQEKGKMVQTKSYAQRSGPSEGLIWKVWSEDEDRLSGLRQLPATTAYAIYGEYQLDEMWKWIEGVSENTMFEQLLIEMKREAENDDVDIDKILKSLDGDWGYALTLDPKNMVNIPGLPPDLKVPAPGGIAIANVNNPVLFQLIVEKMQESGVEAKIESVEAGQLFVVPSPIPDLPFEFAPTLHYSKNQILFATNPTLMKEMLENRATAKTSLLRDPGFRKFADTRLVKANQIYYFSPLLSKSIADLANTMVGESPEMKTLSKVLLGDGEPFGSLITIKAEADGVSVHTTANKRGMHAWIMQHGVPRFGPQLMSMGMMQRGAPARPDPLLFENDEF